MRTILPTLEGFINFIRKNVQIPTDALDDDDPIVKDCYDLAMEFVVHNMGLEFAPTFYRLCVYSLGTSFLFHCANDKEGSTYFKDLRNNLNLNTLSYGIINQASDQGTAAGEIVSPALANLSLADLQLLKDPYGAKALAILMELGPYWGLS